MCERRGIGGARTSGEESVAGEQVMWRSIECDATTLQYHDAIGDERRAVEILEMWKQLYPRDYRAPNALAVSFNRMGQYERAIQEAQEAERRNPLHPFPRSNLA